MSKVILSHPTANANVRAAASGMVKHNILHKFYTSVACFPGSFLYKLASMGPFKEFKRRSFDSPLRSYIQTSAFKEIGRMIATVLKLRSLTRHEVGFFSVYSVYRSHDMKVANAIRKDRKNLIAAVYSYEDGALKSFEAAKSVGKKCFYELPIPYWRCFHKILEEEKQAKPDWATTLTGLRDSQEKLQRKDAELAIADVVFVANSFTARSLELYPEKLNAEIKVLPYGFPPVYKKRIFQRPNGRLKLLFVGTLSQQKGLAYLFEAIEGLQDKIELTIVGRKVTEECMVLNKALDKYRWIPSLPHAEVLKLMRESDVFVFPSLFEGFGMVITEAMAQGTPVITTPNTAGADLIRDGENGWLIEPRSTVSLQRVLHKLSNEPDLIVKVAQEAQKTAASRPWEVYENELAEALNLYLNQEVSRIRPAEVEQD